MQDFSFQTTFYDGVQATAHTVRVDCHANGLTILQEEGGNVAWEYTHVTINDRPQDGRPGKLSYDATPDAQLLVEDPAVFEQILERLPRKRARKFPVGFTAKIGLLIGLLIVLVFFVMPKVAVYMVQYFPESWEVALGQAVMAYIVEGEDICHSKEGDRALAKIMDRLTAHEQSEWEFSVVVVRDKMVNAFALPGGSIMVMEGLIKEAESHEELVGVLAHEVGHVYERHGMQAMFQHLGASALIDIITGGGGTAIYLASEFYQLRHSREAEAEADEWAVKLMEETRIDPRGLQQFFKRLHEEEKESKVHEYLAFMSTHPLSEERSERIGKLAGQYRYEPVLTEKEWYALRRICRE